MSLSCRAFTRLGRAAAGHKTPGLQDNTPAVAMVCLSVICESTGFAEKWQKLCACPLQSLCGIIASSCGRPRDSDLSILPGAGWSGTGGTREAESAKGGWQHPSTYATAYDASRRNRQFQIAKRNTKVALRVQSHVACLLIMFCYGRLAMPFSKRENVRHATLLFRAESVNV